MFGYVSPDQPYLFIKDEKLYQAMYCGLCKAIGKGCGQLCRFTLTYDLAFLSVLFHNIKGEDVQIKKQHCLVHPFKKKYMALVDELSLVVGALNTMLAYQKLVDDERDGDGHKLLQLFFRKGYRRASSKYPKAEAIIRRYLEEQAELERQGCDSVDRACDPTANMMAELSRELLQEKSTEATSALCYAIGKWVYLIDAVDDYDEDVKKGRYNVLKNAYQMGSLQELREKKGGEIVFIFDSLFASMRENLQNIPFRYNHDLTDNIILRGIPLKTRKLFYGTCEKGKKHE